MLGERGGTGVISHRRSDASLGETLIELSVLALPRFDLRMFFFFFFQLTRTYSGDTS